MDSAELPGAGVDHGQYGSILLRLGESRLPGNPNIQKPWNSESD
jgi:hypothetical protein